MLLTQVRKVGSCYVIKLEFKIPHPIDPKEYTPFDYGKAFAGLSARGSSLSHKVSKQAGPARMGNYSWTENPPEGWIKAGPSVKTLFTTTATPRLCFCGRISSIWSGYGPEVAIHPDDKLSNWDTGGSFNTYDEKKDVLVACEDAVVAWLAANPTKARFGWNNSVHLKIVPQIDLSQEDWGVMDRYNPHGTPTAPLGETVKIENSQGLPLRSPSIPEADSTYGVHIQSVSSFWHDQLYVTSLEVRDVSRFTKFFPALAPFAANPLRFGFAPYLSLQIPIDQSSKITGALPPNGLVISNQLGHVFFNRNSVDFGRLQKPLRAESSSGAPEILCTLDHISKGLVVPCREAKLKRQIPDTLTATEAFSDKQHQAGGERSTWFLLEEIEQLPTRSHKSERLKREERKERLLQKYASLPEHWNQFTDEQLEEHFSILSKEAQGEIHPADQHPIFHQLGWAARQGTSDWLKQETDYVCVDPVTEKKYIRHFDGLDEFAAHPKFRALLADVFGNVGLLEQLILSPAAQAAVGASRI